jgi:hypothetical protein
MIYSCKRVVFYVTPLQNSYSIAIVLLYYCVCDVFRFISIICVSEVSAYMRRTGARRVAFGVLCAMRQSFDRKSRYIYKQQLIHAVRECILRKYNNIVILHEVLCGSKTSLNHHQPDVTCRSRIPEN